MIGVWRLARELTGYRSCRSALIRPICLLDTHWPCDVIQSGINTATVAQQRDSACRSRTSMAVLRSRKMCLPRQHTQLRHRMLRTLPSHILRR